MLLTPSSLTPSFLTPSPHSFLPHPRCPFYREESTAQYSAGLQSYSSLTLLRSLSV
ncbi:hypothetical protein A6R68_21197 [Neotoma lepida]|uniref:Uncharacterized protein n=1 Tax=Neotoma lepida TaxID=56216 RepID=A0A1A6HQR9_NEOLE|nr:hypothetical protein A6R68_21197 [Neotoma lepida]